MKPQLLIDVRIPITKEDISLDLARHLPRRVIAGRALIVVDRPQVWLAVLGKRWARIIREVERERASTLDRWKRTVLEVEINRMRELHFGAAPVLPTKPLDVVLVSPDDVLPDGQRFCSLYLTLGITAPQLGAFMHSLQPGGLLTVYGEWSDTWDDVIRNFGK